MIRQYNNIDFEAIREVINDASQAYKGIIPAECWKKPYMSKKELRCEIEEGLIFWEYKAKEV